MRRIATLALTAVLGLGLAFEPALAQIGRDSAEKEAEEAAKRKRRDEEWNSRRHRCRRCATRGRARS